MGVLRDKFAYKFGALFWLGMSLAAFSFPPAALADPIETRLKLVSMETNFDHGKDIVVSMGAAVGAYSSGHSRTLVQCVPQLDVRLNRFHFNTGYTQAAIRGSSLFTGDVKMAKWLRLGGGYGFDILYGQPVPFNKGDFPDGSEDEYRMSHSGMGSRTYIENEGPKPWS